MFDCSSSRTWCRTTACRWWRRWAPARRAPACHPPGRPGGARTARSACAPLRRIDARNRRTHPGSDRRSHQPDPRASARDRHPRARAAHQPCAARPPRASVPSPSPAPAPAAAPASSVDLQTAAWKLVRESWRACSSSRLSRSSCCSTLAARSRMNSTHTSRPES